MDARRGLAVVALATLVAACGGSSSGGGVTPLPPVPPFTSVQQIRVSLPSTFASGCDGVTAESGTLYTNTAVEPYLVANPFNPLNLIAAWQQDRWSNGGAQGLMLAASVDGGSSWTLTSAPFSRCTGGNNGNLGDYARATDPWLSASPFFVYALSLSFNGTTLAPGSSSAMLVARSADFGVTWQLPHALIQDGATVFNDKGSITADPINSSFVYAVWDRLTSQTAGPTYFAVTTDQGSTWQAARSIYDPGPSAQTIGNQIVVLPGDVVLNVFTQIDTAANGTTTASVRVMQSIDNGTRWSAPVKIADLQALGTINPANKQAVRDGSDLVSVSASATSGVVYVAWQDSRFSMGKHDGIALVYSRDGGQSWSTPVQVNADVDVQAFTPTVNVRADGVVAVTYFDLRNNKTPASNHLYADCWMVTSSDGAMSFSEQHLSGSFDLYNAPDSEGLFLGDYQALVSTASGSAFLPFYAQPALGSAVETNAFISFPPAGAAAAAHFVAREAVAGAELTPEARQRVMARTRLVQKQRLRGQ